MQKLFVIKIGGNIIDDEKKLENFLHDFSLIKENKILIHGGGKVANQYLKQLNIEPKMIDGRRITDKETLEVVLMVYGGLLNKKITATLQSLQCNAIGLSGADGNLMQAKQREKTLSKNNEMIDWGYVGDIEKINSSLLKILLDNNFTPVVAPLTHNSHCQILNTNADSVAQEIAKSMTENFDVHLIYSFEKEGVLKNIADENSVIPLLTYANYVSLKTATNTNEPIIHSGMIPKLDNAFKALESGVKKITIGNAEKIIDLSLGKSGTTITLTD